VVDIGDVESEAMKIARLEARFTSYRFFEDSKRVPAGKASSGRHVRLCIDG